MFGINFLELSSLVILAGSGDLCTPPKPTDISVKPSTEKVKLDTTMTLADMQNVQSDTINPHSFGGVSVMQGFANGAIGLNMQAKLGTRYLDNRKKMACVWYDKVEITFDVDPSITIAKEVYADRCMRKAVYDHELKHVMTDRKIVNDFSRRIGMEVFKGLKERGFSVGPVYAEQLPVVMERMQKTVQQILKIEHRRMELARMDAQRAVDSKEEYERVAALCPKFKITREMLVPKKRR